MSYEVLTTDEFLKDAKAIIKVYPGFKQDVLKIISTLEENPEQGDHLGHGIYKLRISITGKPAGKSFGARIIHFVISAQKKVFLLNTYDKSHKKDLTREEMKVLVMRAKSLKENLSKNQS